MRLASYRLSSYTDRDTDTYISQTNTWNLENQMGDRDSAAVSGSSGGHANQLDFRIRFCVPERVRPKDAAGTSDVSRGM